MSNMKELVKSLALCIQATRSLDDSESKCQLWLCSRLLHSKLCSAIARFGFLTTCLRLYVNDAGVVVYTIRNHQVNVNFLIPRAKVEERTLVLLCIDFTNKCFPYSAVDLSFALKYMSCHVGDEFLRTRFVPCSRFIDVLTLEDDHVVLDGQRRQPIVQKINSPIEIRKFKLLSKMDIDDPEDTSYWYKFDTNHVVAFKNPVLPVEQCIVDIAYDESWSEGLSEFTGFVHKFFLCMREQATETEFLDILRDTAVPVIVRCFFILGYRRSFGVTDCIIEIIGLLCHVEEDHHFYHIASCVHALMRSESLSGDVSVQDVISTVSKAGDKTAWDTWFGKSIFIQKLITKSNDLGTLNKNIDHIGFQSAYIRYLTENQNKWSALLSEGVPILFSKLNASERKRSAWIWEEWCLKRPSSDVKHDLNCTDDTCITDVVTIDVTHETLLRKIETWLGYKCTLIGSGIFHNDCDMDVVVTMPKSMSLSEAHSALQAKTNWTAEYENVSDHHVAVLSGTFEGVCIDAQVWRGETPPRTAAEQLTLDAISFSNTLRMNMTPLRATHCILLHKFLTEAKLKGHKFCLLPGIAVTCIAMFLCRRFSTTKHVSLHCLLQEFRNVLLEGVAFEVDNFERLRTCSCDVPIQVVVNEKNVAFRLTQLTSNHVRDMISHCALQPLVDDVASMCDVWRRTHMTPCLTLKACSENITSLRLHTSIAKFDGHPIFQSLFIRETEPNILTVLITLDGSADVARYGFRETDDLHVNAQMLHIARGLHKWVLMPTFQPSTCTFQTRGGVLDVFEKDGFCFPNAPTLAIDAMSCFDSNDWIFFPKQDK